MRKVVLLAAALSISAPLVAAPAGSAQKFLDRAKHVLTEQREQLETLAKALLEYETLSGDEINVVIEGGSIDRGGPKGPTIPAAGSSIPKAKRPASGIGGPATAGA